MTTAEVKEILGEARVAGIKYFKARDKYRSFEHKITGGKAIRFNSTGAEYEHNGNAVENAYCELSDRKTETDRCRAALSKPYRTAGKLIYLVENDKKRQILNMRYLYCKSWNQIAADMKINVRQLHRLHGYALEEISQKA